MKSRDLIFCALCVTALVAALTYTTVHQDAWRTLFSQSSYFLVALLCGIWVYAVNVCVRESPGGWRRHLHRAWPGWVAAAILAGLSWWAAEPGYKVLSDETNLLAVSKSLFFDKTAFNVTMGEHYYDNFWPLNREIPKRPLAFPFLLQIAYLIGGYSPEAAFAFNGVVLFFLLALVYTSVRSFAPAMVAFAAQFFILAQPIVSLSAASAGYDLLSATLHVLCAILFLRTVRRPTASRVLLLISSLLFLGNVRYETIVYLPIALAALAAWKLLRLSHLRRHACAYALMPLTMLPRLWQSLINTGKYENPDGVPVLGWVNFAKHFPLFAKGLVNFKMELPYATVLNLASITLIAVFLLVFARKRVSIPRDEVRAALVIAMSVGIGLVIYLSHHFGLYHHPTQARLFIVLQIALALVPIAGYALAPRRFTPKRLFSAALLLWGFYAPIAYEERFVNKLVIIRGMEISRKFFQDLGTRNILVIADRPGQYTVDDFGAVNFQRANRDKDRLLKNLQRRLYQDIYVVNHVGYNDQDLDAVKHLDPAYELETVYEYQYDALTHIRISKVVLAGGDVKSDA